MVEAEEESVAARRCLGALEVEVELEVEVVEVDVEVVVDEDG